MTYSVKLSLIICSRNRARQLEKFLESIRQEEMVSAGGELVLVNNHSTDNTGGVMRCFQNKSSFPMHIVDEPQIGLAHARNAGILYAQGDVLAFTDDDCYLAPFYLKAASTIFDSGEFDYCGGQILNCNLGDENISYRHIERRALIEPYQFMPAGMVQGANMVLSRRLIEKTGFFDPMFGHGTPFPTEDIEYVARAAWLGFRGALVPELIVFHHHGRRFSEDVAKVCLGYDHGRGAYYMKSLLSGRDLYWNEWFKDAGVCKETRRREVYAARCYGVARICAALRRKSAHREPQGIE
jgi:glycosyltransferase involved in cell wall biosynthesis